MNERSRGSQGRRLKLIAVLSLLLLFAVFEFAVSLVIVPIFTPIRLKIGNDRWSVRLSRELTWQENFVPWGLDQVDPNAWTLRVEDWIYYVHRGQD